MLDQRCVDVDEITAARGHHSGCGGRPSLTRTATAVLALIVALVGLVAAAAPAPAAPRHDPADPAPVADEVDRTAGPDEISVLRRVDGQLEVLGATVQDGDEAVAFASAAASGGEVVAVEVDVDFRLDDDPLRRLQWNLDAVGLEDAAALADGTGVTVAVLDTDIAAGHVDLAGRLLPGWDFVDDRAWRPGDRDRQEAASNHGTHVAGIIAAVTGNGAGIHGAAPGVDLMPVRVMTATGGLSSDVAAGIIWAVDHGADVINLSLSSDRESVLVRESLQYAAALGAVVVASAGNTGARANLPAWPAAHSSVIAVGAIGRDGQLWAGSNRARYLDVVAPGVDIVSLAGAPDAGGAWQYQRATGTSQAAPHVAALAAMMRSVDPSLGRVALQRIIERTATDGGPVGFDIGFGHGVIDAVEAVAAATPGRPTPPQQLWAVDRGPNGLQLRWEHADNSRTGYEVLRDGVVVAALGRGARQYRIGRPDPALAEVFQVRASGPNGSRSAAVGLLPEPGGLAASGAVGAVELAWTAVPGAAGYVVLRDGARIMGVRAGAGPDGRVSAVDTTGTVGRTYRYQVAAQEQNGLSGVRSAPASASPRHPPPVAGGAVAAAISGNTVQLTWPAATGGPVTRYVIERDGTRIADAGTALAWSDSAPPGGPVEYRVIAVGPGGESAYPAVTVQSSAPTSGYRILTDRGRVFAFGDAVHVGDGLATGDVVAGTPTPTGDGYWVAHADGTVEAFGDAAWLGDVRDLPLEAPIVAMAVLPSGGGYWLLAGDGGVFTFGDAEFHGSTGGLPLVAPVIDLAVTPSGQGYWFVAADGGVFTFGDAVFRGSTGGWELDAPVVSMAAGPGGYWLIASDGGVFTFGPEFYGSLPGTLAGVPADEHPSVVRMRPVNAGRGYLLLADDGGIFGYGRHDALGSAHGRLAPGEAVVDLLVS